METTKITKGEMLRRIFAQIDKLNYGNKMIQLFIDNGLNCMDLTELRKVNPAAVDAWQKMYKRSNRLMAFSTYVVLEY